MNDLQPILGIHYACRYAAAMGIGSCSDDVEVGDEKTLKSLLGAKVVVPIAYASCVAGNRVVRRCAYVVRVDSNYLIAPVATTEAKLAFSPEELASFTRRLEEYATGMGAAQLALLVAGYPRPAAERLARVVIQVVSRRGRRRADYVLVLKIFAGALIEQRKSIRGFGDAYELLVQVLSNSLPYGVAHCGDDYSPLERAIRYGSVDYFADLLVIYAAAYTPSNLLDGAVLLPKLAKTTRLLRDAAYNVAVARAMNPEKIVCANRIIEERMATLPMIRWNRSITW